jgi:hypothetical protein
MRPLEIAILFCMGGAVIDALIDVFILIRKLRP